MLDRKLADTATISNDEKCINGTTELVSITLKPSANANKLNSKALPVDL